MEAETIAVNTTSGVEGVIVPENTAGGDTSPKIVPNSPNGKGGKPLGSAQDRLEILAQELRNGAAAGLPIQVRYTEKDGRSVMLIAVWDVWHCPVCNWPNAVPNKCQNDKCQTNQVPNNGSLTVGV